MNSESSGCSDRYLTLFEIQKLVPASRTTIFRWEKAELFPKRHKIGLSKVAWLESSIQAWLRSRQNCNSEGGIK